MEMEMNKIVCEGWSINVKNFKLDPIAIKVAVKTIDDVLKKEAIHDSNETMATRGDHENSKENQTKEEIV